MCICKQYLDSIGEMSAYSLPSVEGIPTGGIRKYLPNKHIDEFLTDTDEQDGDEIIEQRGRWHKNIIGMTGIL